MTQQVDNIKTLRLDLFEECNLDTVHKFLKEHENKDMLPLRWLKLMKFLSKYWKDINKFVDSGL